jgi:hypothetical protein
MFLQQIQCMEVQTTLDSAQQQSRLDKQKSETIESMVAAVDDSIVDKIICYIDELYKKGQNEQNSTEKTQQQSEEQKVGVENSKIDADQALKCARQKLQNLSSTDELIKLLDSFSQNNKLKHIIRENIDMETTFGIVLSDTAETRQKTLELDTKTLTDLLVLKGVLNEYVKQKQLMRDFESRRDTAQKIIHDLYEILPIPSTNENSLQETIARDRYVKLCDIKSSFVFYHQEFCDSLHDVSKVFEIQSPTVQTKKVQLEKMLKDRFQQMRNKHIELDEALRELQSTFMSINKFDDNANSNQAEAESNSNSSSQDKQGLLAQKPNLQQLQIMQIRKTANSYVNSMASLIADQQAYDQKSTSLGITEQLPCLLDPAIESGIDECMKHVIDPTMYSLYYPQEREIDTSTQSDDSNSRLLTIGGIAILGVVTMAAGCYLFSNDDNTTSNRTIQLSQKTNTSMQLAKPTNVSATKTTDVSTHNDNTDITTKSVTTSTTTHQEQTSANKQIK